LFVAAVLVLWLAFAHFYPHPFAKVGDVIDNLNGVPIYFNGPITNDAGRNSSPDGYNIGVKYQCVEFVKRYYFVRFSHKMPESHGNAKDLFDRTVADGGFNKKRGLLQFVNGGATAPQADDIIVLDASTFNPYGHVAIIVKSDNHSIEIAQQNPGPFMPSRLKMACHQGNGKWFVDNPRVLGWLRMPTKVASPAVGQGSR
jgi:hypothetical protein